MSSYPRTVVWHAEAHTRAKIEILGAYLVAWFQILGRGREGKDIFYVDGFAGPGEYADGTRGSPLVAIDALRTATDKSGTDWRAGIVHCTFIEPHKGRFARLQQLVASSQGIPKFESELVNDSFETAIAQFEINNAEKLDAGSPSFYFIDPFGAKGVSFELIARLLGRPTAEIFINFDADGVGRIFKAGEDANHESLLNTIFGCDKWRGRFTDDMSSAQLTQQALKLYIEQLKTLQKVRYVFSFEMRSGPNSSLYYLVFASQHPRGLEKMKEAMKTVDKSGNYRFYAADAGQEMLFDFNTPDAFALSMHQHFCATSQSWSSVVDYSLNETPFPNPKKMLRILEGQGKITVTTNNPNRRKLTYAEGITSITFLEPTHG